MAIWVVVVRIVVGIRPRARCRTGLNAGRHIKRAVLGTGRVVAQVRKRADCASGRAVGCEQAGLVGRILLVEVGIRRKRHGVVKVGRRCVPATVGRPPGGHETGGRCDKGRNDADDEEVARYAVRDGCAADFLDVAVELVEQEFLHDERGKREAERENGEDRRAEQDAPATVLDNTNDGRNKRNDWKRSALSVHDQRDALTSSYWDEDEVLCEVRVGDVERCAVPALANGLLEQSIYAVTELRGAWPDAKVAIAVSQHAKRVLVVRVVVVEETGPLECGRGDWTCVSKAGPGGVGT